MFELLQSHKLNRRETLGLVVGGAATAALLSVGKVAPAALCGATPVELNLTLISDAMTGKQNWPVYVPTSLTVPAHTTINARIVQFDDGAGELPTDSPYGKVTGVLGGSVTSAPIKKDDPNNPGAPTKYQALATKDVAHTFTIGALGLNVPLPVSSVVSFSFQTGDPGDLIFQCLVPCGTDPKGSGGPMVTKDYMMGTLHVV